MLSPTLTRRTWLTTAAASTLIACNRRSRKIVGMIPKGSSNVFWQTVHAGAQKAAQQYGFELEWNAPSLETDSSRQIEIVESMINRQLSGLILAPVDRKALAGVVDKAAVQNIPTVIFDSAIDSNKLISYVATDNLAAGRLAARRLGNVLIGKGKIAILGFMVGSASTMEREQGFQEEVAKLFPHISVVDVRFSNSDRSVAMALAENILTAHPDLRGFFADNEGSSTGAAQALKSRNAKSVKLVAFDTTPQLIDDLRAGWLDSIVVQAPFAMGYQSGQAMGMHLKGRNPPARIDSGARLIRREDLESPEVKELLNPNLTKYLSNGGSI